MGGVIQAKRILNEGGSYNENGVYLHGVYVQRSGHAHQRYVLPHACYRMEEPAGLEPRM